MATDSESPLHSTYIRAILLPPEMFTLPQQDANARFSFYDHDATQSECAHRLATTHSTVISATKEKFSAPTEEAFGTLFDVEKLVVDEIHLAQSFKKWLSCCKCRRKLTDTICSSISTVKCGNCNTVQPISVCCVNASVRIAVRNNKSELIWLNAFTPVLEEMLRIHTRCNS